MCCVVVANSYVELRIAFIIAIIITIISRRRRKKHHTPTHEKSRNNKYLRFCTDRVTSLRFANL